VGEGALSKQSERAAQGRRETLRRGLSVAFDWGRGIFLAAHDNKVAPIRKLMAELSLAERASLSFPNDKGNYRGKRNPRMEFNWGLPLEPRDRFAEQLVEHSSSMRPASRYRLECRHPVTFEHKSIEVAGFHPLAGDRDRQERAGDPRRKFDFSLRRLRYND
jgi:hypothetical protein